MEFFDTGLKGTNPRVIPDGVYTLSSRRNNSDVINISGKSFQPNSKLGGTKLTKEAYQFFFIKYSEENNSYTIMSLHSHLFLGINSEDLKRKMYDVVQNSLSPTFLSQWEIINDNGLYIKLKDRDLFWTYVGFKPLKVSQKNNTDEQIFLLKTVEIIKSGLYYISSKARNDLFISLPKNNESNISYLTIEGQLTENQIFYVSFDKCDGFYSILNMNSMFALSPGLNDKTKLNQNTFTNYDDQKFFIGAYEFKDITQKTFFILSKSENFLLSNKKDNNTKNRIDLELKNFDKDDIQNQNSNNNYFYKFKISQIANNIDIEKNIQEVMRFRYLTNIETNIYPTIMKKIKYQMFSCGFNINKLEIPLFITEIEDNAFINCSRIKTVKCHPKWLKLLPNPLNIENIIVIDGVESIERNSFNNYRNVKYLSLPSSLKFDRCDNDVFNDIHELTIFSGDPKFLSIIKKDKLTKIFIPSNIREIPEKACAGCKNLQELHVDQDTQLELIGPLAFDGCSSLTNFTIPNTVVNIAPTAFQGCIKYNLICQNDQQMLSMLDCLVITENKISQYHGLYVNITSIDVPFKIVECDPNILKRFKKLKKVKCNPKLLNLFNTDAIEIVNIPFGINQIKKENFSNLIHLKFVEIPDTVEIIEQNSFDRCRELTSVRCGIKHFQYLNKNQIKEMYLIEQVTKIEENDFEGFRNLEYCSIPDSIQNIHPNTFNHCKKIKTIDHPNGSSLINNKKTIDANKSEVLKNEFDEWTNLKKLTISPSVKTIENDTYANCINLEYLTCDPKWFPYIPKGSIKTIVIPDYIKQIQKGQFDEFTSLTNIKLPNDIIIDDSCIFDSCKNLQIIKCSAILFENLSLTTRKRCNKKLIQKYENPIFNIQMESKVFDETNLFSDIDSIFDDEKSSAIAENKQSSTSINDLEKYDISSNKYKDHINDVLSNIQSGEVEFVFKQSDTSISEITKLCSLICYKINKSFNIIPNIVQIYSILRLADEILNKKKHGSFAEIKPGEGKTFIITILGIILVKYGHSVDIAVSNFDLAMQNKNEQSKFFELFNISTAALCDKRSQQQISELSNYNDSENIDIDLKIFENSVVYSTNRCFEFYYIHFLHNLIPKKRHLDIVIIDEIDNFIDDEFPLAIMKKINYSSISDILSFIYANRLLIIPEIINLLKAKFPDYEFKYDNVEMFKNAALIADKKTKDIDYIVENNKIIIVNSETGLKMPNNHWLNYVHEMVEIKENVSRTPISLLHNLITHQTYFELYNNIICVTGSLNNTYDQRTLKKYSIDTFKVPRNILSQVEVFYKSRPSSIEEIFNLTLKEIISGKNCLVQTILKFKFINFNNNVLTINVLQVNVVGSIYSGIYMYDSISRICNSLEEYIFMFFVIVVVVLLSFTEI